VSPPLSWSSVPGGTRSFALVVDDPDAPDPAAPERTWVHWVLVDLDPGARGLEPGESVQLADGTRNGNNDWGNAEWSGPCLPIGRQRYRFKLYALDTTLLHLRAPTKAELEAAMDRHILERAELVGTYEKRAA
jgi:Raf kinase inhibitor-like YbhB/YbcL family protein